MPAKIGGLNLPSEVGKQQWEASAHAHLPDPESVQICNTPGLVKEAFASPGPTLEHSLKIPVGNVCSVPE